MLPVRNDYSDVKKLIDRVACGDDSAFKLIYDSISDKMFALCLRIMEGSKPDAEDCFQEGCVRLFKNIRSYRGEGPFEGWVRMIFLNCCISHHRVRSRNMTVSIEKTFDVRSDAPDALDRLYTKDILSHLNQGLPEGRKKIVKLYCVEGYLHTEIAQILGCTESTSKSQLHRARKGLAMALQHN